MAYKYNFATGKLDFYLPTDLPVVPETQVFFSTTLPTDEGVIFTPDTPSLENVLYISEISGQVFIYNGTNYVSYTSVTPNNTAWYLYGTTIDAGGNKITAISRNASIYTNGFDSYFNSVRVGRGKGNIISNTVVGTLSGNSNTTGTNNTFSGYASGKLNTTGSYNTFSGVNSGFSNSTGVENSFFGMASGNANTTANYNTFSGAYSGFLNTTGFANSFFGKSSGGENTTGSRNTFLGESSGTKNTTGQYNTFSGASSGFSNVNGTANTFLGSYSGFDNTTGSDNIFIGSSSGENNTTASYNILVGNSSGFNITTGANNTFFGTSSGFNNITGGDNVLLGTNSGRYISDGVTALTDINTSVFLGKDTKALANSQTNQIVIGYNAIGKGSNTVNIGNASITNTYLNGAVTVNNAYTLPTVDGASNYFLRTNGAGVASWGAAGLTYFSEAQSTTGVNATVYANSLTAVSTTTNADFVLLPKGTGAFIVGHVPDGGITNGGKRGTYAIDIQPASLNYATGANGISAIAIGYQNSSSGNYSTCLGSGGISSGTSSLWLGSNLGGVGVASGDNSVAIQQQSRATAGGAFAIQNGAATGGNSFAGAYSLASGTNSVAMGGAPNYGATASNTHSVAIGDSCVSDARSSVAFGSWTSTKGVAQRLSLGSFQDIGPYLKGHAQFSLSSSLATTTTNTATELIAYGGTAINLVLQNNEAIRVKGSIIGKQTASTNVACYDFDCVIVRGTTAASTIIAGTTPTVSLVVNTIVLDTLPTLTANTTLGGLSIKSGAKTATTIKWSCRIDSTEVILA